MRALTILLLSTSLAHAEDCKSLTASINDDLAIVAQGAPPPALKAANGRLLSNMDAALSIHCDGPEWQAFYARRPLIQQFQNFLLGDSI